MLWRSLERTAAGLGADGDGYARLLAPAHPATPRGLLADALGPMVGLPDHPLAAWRASA